MGEEKKVSMAPKYHPEEVEKARYQFWLESFLRQKRMLKKNHTRLSFHRQT